ncbi:MAG: DUF1573 domain-containing protein [Bacteroidaceae bacterium]|nr:DUF1573 domain-containing protein [Bacteroidaceae bacterium]
MKKIIFFAVALMVTISASAQKANMEFDKTTIDLGKFGSDNLIQKCYFVFRNSGDATLYIHQILTSCGCTSKKYPTYGIQPGAQDTIFVTYNGTNKAPKKFRTSITIHSNAVHEMTKLYIKGEQLPHPIKEVEVIEVDEAD